MKEDILKGINVFSIMMMMVMMVILCFLILAASIFGLYEIHVFIGILDSLIIDILFHMLIQLSGCLGIYLSEGDIKHKALLCFLVSIFTFVSIIIRISVFINLIAWAAIGAAWLSFNKVEPTSPPTTPPTVLGTPLISLFF